ncbi:uncharacterized protein LOC116342761 [Contarinia nasturtii]|uniref:uncharacterized protein LOC116342761 n=1 Tax=Contarinia nasturtii TaxID=265458 RepID=UPI0012D4566D|nr:uncharacterized protein LOC116342761 [Contarinia nasturtii]
MFNGLSFLDKDENEFDNFLRGPTSNEKSNLADIFEADESERANEVNPTLKYVPLKSTQPQTQKMDHTNKPTWNVIIAKIVTAFKLISDINTSIGHLGLALLQNPFENTSKLILYKTKEQILSTFLLKRSTKVYWKPPYLQYHDDMNGFWSLLFTHDADCTDFFAKLEEVCDIDRANAIKFEASDRINMVELEKIEEVSSKSNAEKPDEVDSTNSPILKTKDDVVHRVARIGHQLPKIKPVTADDDSDSTQPSDTEKVPNIKPAYNIAERTGQLPPKPANISVALQPSFWPSSTFDLNSFATENRIQNTEVRMNLSKLDSKMDRMLDNIERLRLKATHATNASDKDEEIIRLEEKVLELKKENRALKMQLTEGEKVIVRENDNDKEWMELQRKITDQEHHIVELKNKWEETEQSLKMGMESIEKDKADIIANHAKEMNVLREELEKKNAEMDTLREQLKEQHDQSNKSSGNAGKGDMIRDIMNQFYVKLYQSIEGKETMGSADILKLTAEIIRKETKAALNSN